MGKNRKHVGESFASESRSLFSIAGEQEGVAKANHYG